MRALLLAAVVLALTAAPAGAAPELVKLGDFTDPVHIASPPNDGRVFVVEQAGRVRIVGAGTFIDLSGDVLLAEERGLLSIAFSPGYAANGLFYVFLTSKPSGDVEVREYRVSPSDPNVASPTLIRRLLDEPHAQQFHNGGQLQFGPDGALYVSIGDNLNGANAQSMSSPFGKILRLDVATGNRSVWSYGLRNPWRFTFDRATGDMIIGDVGENTWEEINWAPAPTSGNGVNWGWPGCEGTAGSCGADPVIAMDHSGSDAFFAIVGGYVVRDPGLPTLNGRYLYGDNSHSRLYSAVARTGADNRPEALTVSGLSSFGEDSCGHLYAASRGSDAVYRLQDGAPSACQTQTPGPGPGAGGDVTKPKLSIALPKLGKVLKRRSLRVAVRCDEACRVSVAPRLRRVRMLATRQRSLAAGQRAVFTIKLNGKTMRKLRRTIDRRGSVRVEVRIAARDAAGNTRIVTKRARLKR